MRKIFICFLISIAAFIFLSGCWSRTEPKNLSLLNSILYDRQDDGRYMLTKEIMKLTGKGGDKEEGTSNSYVVQIDCAGKTLAEAARNEFNGKILFGGNLKARLFTEKYAGQGILSVMDFLTRDPLTDELTWMAVVQGDDPKRIYDSVTGLADMIGDHIDELSKTQPNLKGDSVFISVLDFIKAYYAEGKQPVMGLVKIAENEMKKENARNNSKDANKDSNKDYRLVYEGLAAFKDDQLAGFMDSTEARAYSFVTNEIKSPVISSSDGLTAARVIKSKARIKTRIDNNEAAIDISLKAVLFILQETGNINVTDVEALKPLEQQFNEQLESEIAEAVQKAQEEFQSDIFGFGVYGAIQDPDDWEKIKTDWDDIFSEARINVKADSSFVLSGETELPFQQEG